MGEWLSDGGLLLRYPPRYTVLPTKQRGPPTRVQEAQRGLPSKPATSGQAEGRSGYGLTII